MPERRKGELYGLTAYLLWGLFPLFWPLLRPATAVEILAHRFVWSLAVVLLLLAGRRSLAALRVVVRDRRTLALLTGASVLIGVNWGVYIWAVNAHHVVEASLGYFINPLVTILFGVLLLRERLRRVQWTAVGIGAVAVVVLGVAYGRLPWIGLVLAFSFGLYGLAKKRADVGAVASLTVETAVMAAPALAYLVWLAAAGRATFGDDLGHSALLASSGVVTAIPLLCFGAAAVRVPLTTIGLLQFLTPVMQFLLGVLVRHERMTATRLTGFALVWVALAILVADMLRARHRAGRLVRAALEVS